MKARETIGWLSLIIICTLPTVAWYLFRPNRVPITSYADITHSLGQIAALTGMTMFALTFVFSTRLKFLEDIFGGLDKVYIAHGILGGTALALLMFHPVFLVLKYIPSNMKLAAEYLLPGSFWSINFGIVALLGLILLIYFTLYSKLKYNHWKFSHEFLGLVFIIAILHITLVRGEASRDSIFAGYYAYVVIVSVLGLSAFLYSLLFKRFVLGESIYKIENIKNYSKCFELILAPEKYPLKYRAGQFAFFRFYNNKLTREQHPFSFASRTNDKKIRIIIKDLGDFTNRLDALKIGDIVGVEGPYGRFSVSSGLDQVWLAGGIGITPFIGMAEDIKENKTKADLYYSVKDAKEFIDLDFLKSVEDATEKRFRLFPWIADEMGFINARYVEKKTGNLLNKEFYICGPDSFKKALKDGLMKSGVIEQRIHEERFDLR